MSVRWDEETEQVKSPNNRNTACQAAQDGRRSELCKSESWRERMMTFFCWSIAYLQQSLFFFFKFMFRKISTPVCSFHSFLIVAPRLFFRPRRCHHIDILALGGACRSGRRLHPRSVHTTHRQSCSSSHLVCHPCNLMIHAKSPPPPPPTPFRTPSLKLQS